MKILLLSLLIFSIYTPSFSQIMSLKEDKINGNVKSILLNHLKVVVENDSIYGIKASDNDAFWFNGYIDSYHIFNTFGNCIEFHTYFNDDADDNKTLNIYNDKNLLTEQNLYADNKFLGRLIYKYDNKGRVILVIRYDEKNKETDRVYHFRNNKTVDENFKSIPKREIHNNSWQYIYNNKDQCIEEICISPKGDITFRHIYFYDNNGQISQSISFDSENIQTYSTIYKFDKQQKVVKIIKTGLNARTVSSYTYDSNNNQIYTSVEKIPLPLSEADKEAHFSESASQYKYDNQKNWTEKIFFVNKTPLYVQKREIIYY